MVNEGRSALIDSVMAVDGSDADHDIA